MPSSLLAFFLMVLSPPLESTPSGGWSPSLTVASQSAAVSPIQTATRLILPLLQKIDIRPGTDTLFHNGTILPVGGPVAEAEALLIRNDRIVAVGTRDALSRLARGRPRRIDLNGKTVMPGFVDPHFHLLGSSELAAFESIHPITTGYNWEQAQQFMIQKINAAPENAWVSFHGYDPWLMNGPPVLNKTILDGLTPRSANVAIFIVNMSGHVCYTNTKGLKLAGIDESSEGVFFEAEGIAQFVPFIRKPAISDVYEKGIEAMRSAAAVGVTSINDGGVGTAGLIEVALLNAMAWDRRASVRVHCWLDGKNFNLWRRLYRPNGGNARLRFTGIKFWSDGSTQGYTAAVNQPYTPQDPSWLTPKGPYGGLDIPDDNQFRTMVQAAHDAGWTVAIHANGDRALDQVLRIHQQVQQANPRPDMRHSIQHNTVATPDQYAVMRRLRLTPSYLFGHVYYWGPAFRDHILGPERAARLDPARWALIADENGPALPFSFHSDGPVTPPHPLLLVQTAVTRKSRSGETFGPDLAIGIDDALKAITLHPAWQIRREAELGSLEPGKLADLVILDDNPRSRFRADPEEIGEIEVLETWVGGVPVFPDR